MESHIGLIMLQAFFWSLFVIVVFLSFKILLEKPLMGLFGRILNLLYKRKG